MCHGCFEEYMAMLRKDGAEVRQREFTETIVGIKRSPYRTDQ